MVKFVHLVSKEAGNNKCYAKYVLRNVYIKLSETIKRYCFRPSKGTCMIEEHSKGTRTIEAFVHSKGTRAFEGFYLVDSYDYCLITYKLLPPVEANFI